MTIKTILGTFFIVAIQVSACFCFHIDNFYSGGLGKATNQNISSAHHFFSSVAQSLSRSHVITEPKALLSVIKDTLRYFEVHRETEKWYPTNSWLSCSVVKKTLEFVAATIEQDLPSEKFRILDPNFIQENFKILKWSADAQKARQINQDFPVDGRIRLTNYAVFSVDGSLQKTASCPYALYQLQDRALQKKYTKQQILAGTLDLAERHGRVRPLVWLSRDGLEDALMQGTIAVRLPNGNIEIFGLDCDNGIVYDKALKDPRDQKRYWFFRRVTCSGAHTSQAAKQIAQRSQVVFAGDIAHLGVGKLIAIKYQDPISNKDAVRLGVLADTGSAFSNNLYQLDLFAGLFSNRQQFSQYMRTQPQFADAFILYRPA